LFIVLTLIANFHRAAAEGAQFFLQL
jgi:hypothetical protein